jgi:hypothetical protein
MAEGDRDGQKDPKNNMTETKRKRLLGVQLIKYHLRLTPGVVVSEMRTMKV